MRCACVVCDGVPADTLMQFGREWAPRVELVRPGVVMLEASGLARLFGSPAQWTRELSAAAITRGWGVRVAVASTRVAALLLALGRAGTTVVAAGQEGSALAPLPLRLLGVLEALNDEPAVDPAPATRHKPRAASRHYRLAPAPTDQAASPVRVPAIAPGAHLLATCTRWGLSTLGDLAALKEGEVAARLGEDGRRWHQWARGCDVQPLVDRGEPRIFEGICELEWPIDGLEPLSFVLARVLEPLCADLRREERGAALVHTTLALVSKATHARTLQLPAPMNDPKVLRTLILLDLEVHPPDAGIDRVTVRLEPLPGRRVQYSLFRRPLPAPDQVATLMARLQALMGEGRCGSPRLPDTHRPGVFTVVPFAPEERVRGRERERSDGISTSVARDSGQPQAVLRRFRRPPRVQVELVGGRPARVRSGRALVPGGMVEACAGPWRTSGLWWHPHAWSRDEWDVALRGGAVYRLSRAHATDDWVIEGVWD